jgi:hypothetical protein
MAANSWNPSSFVLPFSSSFSRTSLRALCEIKREGWIYGWQARPCTNLHGMYRWFGVVPQGGEVIFGALCWWSFEDDFLGFLVGITYEDLVPLWMVTLPPNLYRIGLDLVVFRVGRVLDLEWRFLRFLLIVSDSGRFL